MDIKNLNLENPLILASGILAHSAKLWLRVINSGAAGITTKSISLEERDGHENPTILATKDFFINAVGLSGPGIVHGLQEVAEFKKISDKPIIVSIFAQSIKEFGIIAKRVSSIKPDSIEVNISCPNIEKESKLFSADPKSVYDITEIVKENTNAPVIVKLSPNVTDICNSAIIAEKAGADILTVANTVQGMVIDLETKKPILSNKVGGVSGPAIKPIAVKNVYKVYESVKIPIIGSGGVSYGKDAIEMFMAGASALAIGSAVYYRGIDCFRKINDEIKAWLKEHNYKSIKEIIGAANEM